MTVVSGTNGRPVLIANAVGEDERAELLAGPLRIAGYDVVYRGSLLVGDSLVMEASRVLAAGGPVVLCGTIHAMGTGWAYQLVHAARAHDQARIFGVQMERGAYLKMLTLDAEVGRYWEDPFRASQELVAALATYYPLVAGQANATAFDFSAERRFRDLSLAAHDIIELANLPNDVHVATRQLLLRSLFVPLKVRIEQDARSEQPMDFADVERRRGIAMGHPAGAELRPVRAVASSLEAVGRRLAASSRVVVLGDPGAGKSTLLRWIATSYLLRLRADPDWSALPAVDTLPDKAWLPVLLRCRDLRPSQLDGSLHDILRHSLRRTELSPSEVDTVGALIVQRLTHGSALLMFDGLDEINDAADRARFCRHLEQIHLAYPDAPIIATSRIVGYRDMGYRIGRGFDHVTIADLDKQDKDDFITRWCAVTETPARQQPAAAELRRDIHSTERIERLTGNPMLLTTMALVKRKVGKLPDRRADLYREAVHVLLNWRAELDEPIDAYEALPQLEYVAYAMADRGVQRLPEDELLALLERMRTEYPTVHAIHQRSPREFIRLLERRTGLLVEAGYLSEPGRQVPVFEFRHLTFQEYLAALALRDGRFPGRDRANSLAQNIAPLAGRLKGADRRRPDDEMTAPTEMAVAESWREVIRLCSTICNDDDADAILHAICDPCEGDDPTLTGRPRAIMAAMCLVDEPNVATETATVVIRRLLSERTAADVRPSSTLATAVVAMARSRWAPLLLRELTRTLRENGDEAVSDVGVLLGSAAFAPVAERFETPAPLPDAAVGVAAEWLCTMTSALTDGSPDEILTATLALAEAADQSPERLLGWPVGHMIELLNDEDPMVATAAARALAQIRRPWSSPWLPTDAELDTVAHGLNRPDATPIRLLAIASILGESRSETAAMVAADLISHAVPHIRAEAALVLGTTGSHDRVDTLLELLDDPDTGVQTKAIDALGFLQDIRAVDPLLDRIAACDAYQRAHIVWAFGQLTDERSFATLITRLDDTDSEVRNQATWALGTFQSSSVVDLVRVRLNDADATVRARAAWSLGFLGNVDMVPALRERLADPEPAVRADTGRALGQLADTESFDDLVTLLDEDDTTVRNAAAHALGLLSDPRGIEPLLAVLADRIPHVRASAAWSLGQLCDHRVLDDLLPLLHDDSPHVRRQATYALGEFESPRAVDALLDQLDDARGSIRLAAALSVWHLDDARIDERLMEHLSDPDLTVVAQVAWALGRRGDPRGSEPIRALRDHPAAIVRCRAIEALGYLPAAGAEDQLLGHLAHPVARARWRAVRGLGLLGSLKAVDAVRHLLTDPNPFVRSTAVWALGRLTETDDDRALTRTLDDSNAEVRLEAALALGGLGATHVVPALFDLADAPFPKVAAAAIHALGLLDPSGIEDLLRSRFDTARAEPRRAIAAVLASRGNSHHAGLLAAGLRSPFGPERRTWVKALAHTLPDHVDRFLLSRDLDCQDPYVDPFVPITANRVHRAARRLRMDESTVKNRLEGLTNLLPLRFS